MAHIKENASEMEKKKKEKEKNHCIFKYKKKLYKVSGNIR